MRKNWLMMVVLVVVATCTSVAMADWMDNFTGTAGSALNAAWVPTTIGQLDGSGFAYRKASGFTYRALGEPAADVILEFTFKTVGTVAGSVGIIGLGDTEVDNYTQVEIRTAAGTAADELKFVYNKDGTYYTMKTVSITQDTLYDVRIAAATTASWWVTEYKESSSSTWISGGGSTYVSGVDRAFMAFFSSGDVRVDKIGSVPEPVTLGILAVGGILALVRRRRR